jgi:hypothetical protein
MAWLGEELPDEEQDGRTAFAPRCLKDIVEGRLLAPSTCFRPARSSTSWTRLSTLGSISRRRRPLQDCGTRPNLPPHRQELPPVLHRDLEAQGRRRAVQGGPAPRLHTPRRANLKLSIAPRTTPARAMLRGCGGYFRALRFTLSRAQAREAEHHRFRWSFPILCQTAVH